MSDRTNTVTPEPSSRGSLLRFWRDPLLISLACFTLVWQGWASTASPPPMVVVSKGVTKTYPVPRDRVGFQKLCDTLMRDNPAVVEGKTGLIRWRSEIAAIYATRQPLVATMTKDDESVMRLASSGRPVSSPTPPDAVWSNYWTEQSNDASTWLAKRESAYQQSLIAHANLAFANRNAVGMPPIEIWIAAFWLAGVSLIVCVGWILVQPVKRLSIGGNATHEATHRDVRILTFQPKWLTLTQPFGVRLRRWLGAGLVAAAILVTVGNFV